VSYYLTDHLGSIAQVTNSSGAVTLTREYDLWGNLLLGSATSGYAYTGREWDAEAGIYYYRARYYDPKIGRFISEDTIGFEGGRNFFRYVHNSPIKFKDPTGQRCTYSQSSGVMCCKDDMTQEVYYHQVGYSGYPPGRNNPDWEDSPETGPIPRGLWKVGEWSPPTIGLRSWNRPLYPQYPNDCGGVGRQCRTFYIHFDSTRYPGLASYGCIILPDGGKGIRTGEMLTVVR
jgi:RHS repeat-associated protein